MLGLLNGPGNNHPQEIPEEEQMAVSTLDVSMQKSRVTLRRKTCPQNRRNPTSRSRNRENVSLISSMEKDSKRLSNNTEESERSSPVTIYDIPDGSNDKTSPTFSHSKTSGPTEPMELDIQFPLNLLDVSVEKSKVILRRLTPGQKRRAPTSWHRDNDDSSLTAITEPDVSSSTADKDEEEEEETPKKFKIPAHAFRLPMLPPGMLRKRDKEEEESSPGKIKIPSHGFKLPMPFPGIQKEEEEKKAPGRVKIPSHAFKLPVPPPGVTKRQEKEEEKQTPGRVKIPSHAFKLPMPPPGIMKQQDKEDEEKTPGKVKIPSHAFKLPVPPPGLNKEQDNEEEKEPIPGKVKIPSHAFKLPVPPPGVMRKQVLPTQSGSPPANEESDGQEPPQADEEEPKKKKLVIPPKFGMPGNTGFGMAHPMMMQELQFRLQRPKKE
ncbi:nucleolar protein dao-5-like [Protopterus annectens]|uniref:nucleolar protein dao-5-like n=1 Tax=Protopterus annectens TaxID=7888 RepID=UPI001CFA8E02|nr:nucleolar protein dao-5-like [Protopterus annectens]